MNAERTKRVLGASISTAVLLLFILLCVLGYQLLLILNTKTQIKKLNQEILELEKQNGETQDEIDIWLNNWKITERANELGWLYSEDK